MANIRFNSMNNKVRKEERWRNCQECHAC